MAEGGPGVEGLRTAVPSTGPSCGLYAPAVDGTAAGDAFGAALVVSLLQGRERGEAPARACAAGAIAASRPGAQPSLPTAAKLEEILAR